CQKPLCRHSQVTCRQCVRHTCQAHLGLCHAAEGQPVALTAAAPPEPPPPQPEPLPPSSPQSSRQSRTKTPPPKPKPRPAARAAPAVAAGPKAVSLEVLTNFDTVAA